MASWLSVLVIVPTIALDSTVRRSIVRNGISRQKEANELPEWWMELSFRGDDTDVCVCG